MPIPTFAIVKVGSGSRQAVDQSTQNLVLQSASISVSWGTEPAQASLVYVPPTIDLEAPGVAVGARVQVEMMGYTFWGYCRSDTPTQASRGFTRTMQFLDNRDFLKWDKVFGSFNMIDRTIIGNAMFKRYTHILPWNHPTMTRTYTDSPYTAIQILNFLFNAPTVQDLWVRSYHADQADPVYAMEFSGESLQSAVGRITEAQGLVVTLAGAPFRLVWGRKGEGPAITIPTTSDDREVSYAITENPTAVNVMGDRNLYQVHDIAMVPDWKEACPAFSGSCGCRRSGRQAPPPPPSPATPGGCGRAAPGAPRNCGSRSRRSARGG